MAPTLKLCVVLILVSTIHGYMVLHEPRADVCQRTGPICSADCKEILFCAAKGAEGFHVATCDDDFCHVPDGEGAYPECGGDSCKSDKFLCLAPGGLPDPTNTTAYYLCPAVFMDGIHVQCAPGQSFDVIQRSCVGENATTIDTSVQCSGGAITFGPLDSADEFCYLCNDQGILMPYPCSLEENTKIFNSIGYQLPAN